MFELAMDMGRTVDELKHSMSSRELRQWVKFKGSRPTGWREDLRTFYIMKSMGLDKKPEDVFPSLMLLQQSQSKDNEYQLRKIRGNPFINKMLMPHIKE